MFWKYILKSLTVLLKISKMYCNRQTNKEKRMVVENPFCCKNNSGLNKLLHNKINNFFSFNVLLTIYYL